MSDVKRIYVEKRTAYATEANEIKHNLIEQLGLEIDTLTMFIKKNFLLIIKK